ncbi:DNA polymerase IV [Comamonas sp. 17RB]|uniref:DNA polymerase IV n=1 Tax=Comamonas sp. 17RB TaxID=3047025 RepID=UPI0024B6D547|nr:DNA polymerase IV [Comamonas sp. 17RB]MDI9854462.1 DNA polymerase IV [Comamonas sp. 17RB]
MGAVNAPAPDQAPAPAPTVLPRRIAHLDMDAFFASVELLRYPQLQGLPVVIGGSRHTPEDEAALIARWGGLEQIPLEAFPRLAGYVGRGVITTATYPARQFGVGSAMGMMKAARLCPQAILLPIDFVRYRTYSRRFKEVILSLAPVMEDRGVDEVYIDFTAVPGGQEEGGRALAARIQQAIHAETGLTCSVGVAPNKLLAKMASEFQKPRGISIVQPQDLEQLIWPLACRKINGIGPKADARLKALGITTIGDLAACSLPFLVQHFGKSYGAWLHAAAHGQDERPVVTESEPVSMSRETTFERDLHAVQDKAELGAIFTRLCERVAEDLVRKGYAGRTIGIKLRYADFRSVTRDMSLDHFTQDAAAIRRAAGLCLKRVPLQQRIRLLGVRVGALVAWENGAPRDADEVPVASQRSRPSDPFTAPLF